MPVTTDATINFPGGGAGYVFDAGEIEFSSGAHLLAAATGNHNIQTPEISWSTRGTVNKMAFTYEEKDTYHHKVLVSFNGLGADEVQVLTLPGPPVAGTFTIRFHGIFTAPITWNASAATVEAALEAIAPIGVGNVSVSGSTSGPYTITFQGTLAKANQNLLWSNGHSLSPAVNNTVSTTTQGEAPIWETFDNAGWHEVALTDIDNGGMAIDFFHDLRDWPKGSKITKIAVAIQLTGVVSGSRGELTLLTITYATNASEVQVVTVNGSPTGGTFTMRLFDQTSSNIAYNASAATVEAALEALSNIGVGNVAVTGSAGGPWTPTFQADLANTQMDQLVGDGALLTGGSSPSVTVSTTTQGADQDNGNHVELSFPGEPDGTDSWDAATALAASRRPDFPVLIEYDKNVSVLRSDGGYGHAQRNGSFLRKRTQAHWDARDTTNRDDLETFLKAHIDEAWIWTPHGEAASSKWVALEPIDIAKDDGGNEVWSLTAQLVESNP